jgi:hypothetical protein
MSLEFGNQPHNTKSASQALTLTNTGTITLPINGISLIGTNPLQFSQSNDCGSSLGIGASCTVNVSFNPTSTGGKIANLSVALGANAGSESTTLAGTGT